jgi:hypothetical protein
MSAIAASRQTEELAVVRCFIDKDLKVTFLKGKVEDIQ